MAWVQVGKAYASSFEPPSSGKFYCSSLVEYAYQTVTKQSGVFVKDRFTLLFVPLAYWTRYYAAMNQTLPLNVTGSNPTLLLHSGPVAF